MSEIRRFAPFGMVCSIRTLACLLFSVVSGAAACAAEPPALVSVTEITPRASEVLDSLTIKGAGFAAGSTARVRFDGQVFRPGQPPEPVSVEAVGRAESREQLILSLNAGLIGEFCGLDEPRHATFVGSVTVAFRPRTSGAPPVAGKLTEVRLDFYPPPDQAWAGAEQEPLTEYWGAVLGREVQGVGLVLTHISLGGRADGAGLKQGDRIVRYDGLSVRGLSDLLPHPGQREAILSVRRPGDRGLLRLSVDVSDYAPRPASEWDVALSLGGALVLWLALQRAFMGRCIALLQWQRRRREDYALRPTLGNRTTRPPKRTERGVVAFLLVSALFGFLAFRLSPFLAEVDLIAAVAIYLLCLGLAQLLGGGFGESNWSLWRALRSVLRSVVPALVVAACIAPLVVVSGGLSLSEIVAEQGGSVLRLNVFKTPSLFLAALGLLSVICVMNVGVLGAESRNKPVVQRRYARQVLGFVRSLEFLQTFILCGLFVAVFMGGWGAPWAPSTDGLSAGGALFFQLKLTALYLGVTWLRRQLPQVPERYTRNVLTRNVLPATLAAALVSPVWNVSTWPEWLRQSWGWMFVGATLLVGLNWLVTTARKSEPVNALNPWI